MANIAQETAFVMSDIAYEFLDYGIYGAIALVLIILYALRLWRRK